ncbi:LapA family protein [Desulfosporosinus sp. BG]|uniref:LapA family protein n=1 Tax=Desulfosporosinus sp. BG TaxID=1633135 RepID=UPI00083AA772|nr:LapA family protein [Desulfosporosinus sp. BG]ODA40903.1 putative integral membrane protein [Desulfosporosinus sp. BG]
MFILILALIFALLIAIFALQNASPVAIQLFWLTKDVPLVLIILGSAFIGALIMLLLALWRVLRLKRKAQLNNQHMTKEIPTNLLTHEQVGDTSTETNSKH